MRGTAKGARLALSDDVLSKVCQLPTIKGRVTDVKQFSQDIRRIVDDSWSLHTAIKAIPWQRLKELESSKFKAYAAFKDARDNLKVVLDDPQAKLDLLAARTDNFQKTLRKLRSAQDRFASAWSFLDRIKSAEEKRKLIDAWLVVWNYGFGSRKASPTVISPPQIGLWGRAQRDARFSAAVGAVEFNIQSSEQRDRFLKDLVGLPSKREPGRPVDSKTHLECRLFVHSLLEAVGSAGGDLPFDKDNPDPERGLLGALYLLAPYVPPRATCELLSSRANELPPGMPGLLAEIRKLWRAERKEDRKCRRFFRTNN
jgi:hypothetical protein